MDLSDYRWLLYHLAISPYTSEFDRYRLISIGMETLQTDTDSSRLIHTDTDSFWFFTDITLTLSGPGSKNQSWGWGGKNAPPVILVYGDSDPVENLGTW